MKQHLSTEWRNQKEFTIKLGAAIDAQRRDLEKRFIERQSSLVSKLELDQCQDELGRVVASCQQVTVRSTSNDFDHSSHIENSKTVRIIMNDGFRFFEKYQDVFERRVAAALPRTTEICLMAPEGPHFETVARRSEKSNNEQRHNILRSEQLVRDIFKRGPDPSNSQLHLMKNFFPYCLFQYDDLIITSVYFNFLREEELPMYLHPRTENPSHVYFQLLKNTDKLFRRAGAGDATWFHGV